MSARTTDCSFGGLFFAFAGSQKQVRFDAVLLGVEVVVAAAGRVEFLVGPALDDAAGFDHQDLIGAADGREPVRDDERGAALHQVSEAFIQQGLAWLMRGRTTFVIAHRLSTIRRADQILVLDSGRVVERGTHVELYAKGGRYREMYDRQHGVQQDLFLAPGEGGEAPASEEEAGEASETNVAGTGSVLPRGFGFMGQ